MTSEEPVREPLDVNSPPTFIPTRKNGTSMSGSWKKLDEKTVGQLRKHHAPIKACGYCLRCNQQTYLKQYVIDTYLDCKKCRPEKNWVDKQPELMRTYLTLVREEDLRCVDWLAVQRDILLHPEKYPHLLPAQLVVKWYFA